MIQDIHPHQFSNYFQHDSSIQENDYVFHFKDNSLLLKQNGKGIEIPKKKELESLDTDGIFLFTLNNTSCFLVWECKAPSLNEFSYHEIKFRNSFEQKEIDWSTGVALQLRNWYQDHKFCGKCGTENKHRTDERAVFCPSCETSIYPNIHPAIIVAITCKNKLLLARGAHFPEGFYSLVAGYVDIGESIEGAVIREVQEEVGINIKNIRYYKSQPWPFSGSMMIGFIAEAEDGQLIQVDNKEILEADWYCADNLPNHPANRSIAGELIDKFKKGEL